MADNMEELENTVGTGQSVQTHGVPVITFGISPSRLTTYPTDPTLSNEGQPADAKECGDRFRTVNSAIGDLGADLTYFVTNKDNFVMNDDVVTNLTTTGKPAESKAVGDAIAAANARTGSDINVATGSTQKVSEIAAAVNALYPVGSVYVTTGNVRPPSFFGTWTEIVMPMTWADANGGYRTYTAGTGTGTVHFWRRTE